MTTAASNVRRSATGHRVGESHHRAVLTDAQVDRIRTMHAQGVKLRAIALWCGAPYWTVVGIALRYRRTYPTPIRVLSSPSAAPLRPAHERSEVQHITDCEAIRSTEGAEARPQGRAAKAESRSRSPAVAVLCTTAPIRSVAEGTSGTTVGVHPCPGSDA